MSIAEGHGGRIDAMAAAFPQAPLPWLDCSTGINPFAYPVSQVASAAWQRLPLAADRDACEAAMAAAFGCSPEACRAVAGTEAAIRQLPAILGAHCVALTRPSYADHEASWRAADAEVLVHDDPLTLADRADAVVLVNPNNPDGRRWPREQLEEARRTLAARRGCLILDEAYADLDPARSMAPHAGAAGLIVLRSFGKFFGLAGLRLGAVLGPRSIRHQLDARLGGWDVSGPALAIGGTAYRDLAWQEEARERLHSAARDLVEVIREAGLIDTGGTDLFRYVRCADAASLWRRLAECGVAIRRFEDDAHHVRIGLPGSSENLARLTAALSP